MGQRDQCRLVDARVYLRRRSVEHEPKDAFNNQELTGHGALLLKHMGEHAARRAAPLMTDLCKLPALLAADIDAANGNPPRPLPPASSRRSAEPRAARRLSSRTARTICTR